MARLRPSTLRGRLFLLVGVAVIPVTAGILYAGFEQRRQAIADVEREALTLARNTASEEDRLVVETRQLLTLLAQVPQVRRADRAECGAFLAKVMAEGGRYANMGVARPDGMIHCSALPIAAPVDASFRSWFTRAAETGEFAVGDYQIGAITGIGSVNFGYPIRDAAALAGVIFVALPLTWLQERLAEAELPAGSVVLVVNGAATVLARYPEHAGWVGRSLAGTPLAEAILADDDEAVTVVEGLDGASHLYATTLLQDLPDDQPVVVSVGIPAEVAYAPVNVAVARDLALLSLALVLVLGVTWWTSGRLVLKPVTTLLRATQRLSGKDLGTRAAVTGAPREIEDLGSAFNEMAATLQQHVGEIEENLVQIKRLNRVRAVLSGINSAILRIRDRDELVREACRISVEQGGFALAWVAELDPTTGEIRVVARAGRDGEDIEVPEVLRSDGGMVATALRDGREAVSNDLRAESWGEEGEEEVGALGFRSAAALPLRVGDRVLATLNLYTTEADFFTEEEIRLLRDLTADTSLGLEYLEKEEQLHYLANYDPLTGLPNRNLFRDRLQQAIGSARQEGRLAAVLMIGIDRLSEINATLGHQAGDLVLQTVASHLRGAVGEANTAARLGSKDFGIVLAEVSSIHEIERVANEILESIPRELSSGQEQIFLSLRIGIAAFPHDGDESDVLTKAATLALEAASSAPAHPVAFYSADFDAEAQRRRKLKQELRSALEQGELALYYQPVVDLASSEPIGMEALVRWHSPELGDVPPATFIPLAEEMGIIGDVGEWVLATAAREGRRLHDEGFRDLRMNVNVSVNQFRDPVFIERFTRIIDETGIDLSRLGIGVEITESELMENIQDALVALERFRQAGMWIYIDDFGTGYSSLNYLRLLPIDALKIDRSFIRDIPADRNAVAVVKSILALAQSLDLRVIAEGVETEEQLSILRDLGCDAAQGYLFSRPVVAEALEAFLGGKG